MASIIKLKRSSSASAVPANSSLQAGELAINLADKKLYSANATGHTIQLSGDDFTISTVANTNTGSIKQTGTGNGSNSQVNITGANGVHVTSDGSGAITITANTFDYDMSAGGTAATGTIALGDSGGNDGDSDTVTISGNNGIVVSNTSTSALLVENKGAQHTVTVAGGKFVIDGTSQQDLRLVPGVIYWFDQSDSSNSSHPLAFGTAANGSEVSQGTASGFTIYEQEGTPGSAGAYTRVQLQQDAPNHLYYFCENHSGMGADVFVMPDNLYSNATHVVATNSVSVTGGLTVSAGIVGSGNVTVGDTLIVTNDADISGEVNAASGAIVGVLTVGGNAAVTGDVTARDLTLSGNLTVSGTTTTVESTTVNINDNMLSLADNQTGTDTDAVDIGFYGTFDEGGTDKYSGIFRDQSHSNKAFVFVEGITTEPSGTVTYNAANSSSSGSLAQVDAIIDGGTY